VSVQSFSGAHPFRPQCLVDAYLDSQDDRYARSDAAADVADLIGHVGEGRCLRCGVGFADGEIPSGSRVTECRCIPICRVCSESEAYAAEARARVKSPDDAVLLGLLAPVVEWPVSPERVAEAVMAFRARYLGVGMVEVGEMQDTGGSGGWVEFGFDESADCEEREGRGRGSRGDPA